MSEITNNIDLESVKHWTDEQIIDYLHQFWGVSEFTFECFISDIPLFVTNKEAYIGSLAQFRTIDKGVKISYPDIIANKYIFFNIRKFSNNYVNKGWHKVSLRLADREFRDKLNNPFLMTPVWRSLKPVHLSHAEKQTKSGIPANTKAITPKDKKDDDNPLLKDPRTSILIRKWGKSIFRLVGVYTIAKEGSISIECVRKVNFSRLENTPLSIALSKPLMGLVNGDCFEFSWKYANSEDYLITVDRLSSIKKLGPQEIITRLYHGAILNEDRSTDLAFNGIETNRINISGQDRNTFIYELLQNANDYPQKDSYGDKIPVHVEFEFEGDYLYFRHTGAKFTVQNILGICGIGEKEKIDNVETIGYKGVGFKNVFIDCDYVYIKTGDYSFRFDKSKIERSAVSFETTPIWTTGIPHALRPSFEKNKDYNVQIALKPRDNSIIDMAEDGYIDRFLEAFNDPRIIIFIPWIESVTLKVPGHDDIVCTRNGNEGNWLVSDPNELKTNISPEIKSRIAELVDARQGRMPEKYKYKTDTSVSFACMVDGNVLKPVDDSRIYCYLPTKDSWGFKFLMNTDMIPTGPRDGIEQQEYWNIEYSEIAGRAFFKWIQSLIKQGYDYDSVFSLIPDFEECKIGRNKDHVNMITRFQKGFEECITTQDFVPVLWFNKTIEYACIKNIVLDITSITGYDVFEDGAFLTFSKLAAKLAHPSLRLSPNFKRVLNLYGEKSLRFDKSSLWNLFKNSDFVTWLKIKDNNTRWTNYIVDKYPEDYSNLPMFISEHDTTKLYLAADLYYDIDDILPYLSAFANLLPRLSTNTRENCKLLGNEKNQGKFKKREMPGLIDGILFSNDNIANTQKSLETKINSINFIKFLSIKKFTSASLFNKIPLIDIDGKLIPANSTSITLRKLFFNSEFVTKIRNEKWFSKSWITVLDDEYYSEDSIKEYLKGYNISELDDHYVINNLLVDGKCCEDVSANIGDSKDISQKFIEYLFTHQDSIDGIEVKTSETEKTTKYDRFTGYSIFFVNGKGEEKFLPVSKDNVFNEITDTYLHYGWFDNSWIYQVALSYYDGKDENEKKSISAFLKKYFGLVDLNDSKFKGIIKDHFEEIKPKITENCELNLSFWTFLGKYQWNENSKDLNVFRTTPLLLDEEKLPTDISGKKNLYHYNEELHVIAKSTWMPTGLITLLSKEFDNIPGIKDLLDIIGFGTYDVRVFSPFFDNVILNQAVPTSIPEQVTPTAYSVSLDTKDKCVDFHNFMSKKYSLLNDFEKSLLRGTPVYVYGREGLRRFGFGFRSFILGEDKYGVLEKCNASLLPEINALDSSFVTEDNLPYWKDVMGCIPMDDEMLSLWIGLNSTTISQTLQSSDKNITFWTWLFDQGISSQAKLGRLKNLPIITFTTRNIDSKEENINISSLSDSEVYMANSYMGQAQIEDFARKHGKTNFVSSQYIREADSIDEWRRFFRNLGVKDDVKDVIYSIIMNDLPTMQDKKLPWVLVDQYSTELADPVKWVELAPKLKELQVETTTEGVFVSVERALRITVDDYSQKEPFKMVKLTGEISRDYYQDENVKNLINKIAEEAKTNKIAELQQWQSAKVTQYLLLQDSLSFDVFKDIHFSFIKELFGHTEHLERNKIKLYDREWQLTKSEELYLGSKYECKCDFERFGITKKFVNDEYLELGKANDCSRVLRSIGCQDRFKENDIEYLTDKDFSIYFWCKYVGSKDITIIGSVNSWVKDEKFNDVACIPSESGEMKRACDLYSSSLTDYMRYIPDYQKKIIDKRMQFTEPLIELCKQCRESLSIGDIFFFLIKSKPNNRNRTVTLQWLLDVNSEYKEQYLATYITREDAQWLNGQGQAAHVSTLLAIDPSNCSQAYIFKSSPRVIDLSYFPQSHEVEVCNMFKIPVFSDEDLVPKPVTTPDSGQTLKVSKEIIRRLLLVIAYRYGYEWNNVFCQMKQKMQDARFMLCESISYGYEDLSIDNEDFYFDINNKTFYYVDSWQDKKVYESFVSKLCMYLDMDLDYRECKGKLDENFNGRKVASYLNQNCRDLYQDEEFVSVIKLYWNDIIELLDMKKEVEPDVEEEEIDVEDVTEGKYYDDELNEKQQEEQEEQEEKQHDDSQEEEHHEQQTKQTESTQSSSQEEKASTNTEQSTEGASSKTTESQERTNTESTNDKRDAESQQSTDSSKEESGASKTSDSANESASSTESSESKSSTNNSQTRNSQSERENNTSTSSTSSNSGGQRRKQSYEPRVPTKEEINRFKYDSSTKTFTSKDPDGDELDALNKILGEGLSAEEIVTENYLAQLRFWESLRENGFEISGMSQEEFIRDSQKDKDYELTNGKYIHRCSAKGGVLYISPSIWNKISDDRCIVCVFVGAKVNEFFYIRNKQDLLDWIDKDAIVIKLTGPEKVEAVNRLYSEVLMGTSGTAYTLIRLAYNESYSSLFADIEYNNYSQTEINDDDY